VSLLTYLLTGEHLPDLKQRSAWHLSASCCELSVTIIHDVSRCLTQDNSSNACPRQK